MAADAAMSADGSIVCPNCGCSDFRVYKTDQGLTSTFRYKACRHCGYRVLTSTKSAERIVRAVDVRQPLDADGMGDIDDDDSERSESIAKFA